MDVNAFEVMFGMILRFKDAATSLEAGLAQYREFHGRPQPTDDAHPATSFKGGVSENQVIANKAVSHFLLGSALELMYKLILSFEGAKKLREGHSLSALHDDLSSGWKKKVIACYDKAREGKPPCLHIAYSRWGSVGAAPRGGPIKNYKEYLACFDNEMHLATHRYSWERVRDGNWVYFIDDFTMLTDTIDGVMRLIRAEADKDLREREAGKAAKAAYAAKAKAK